MTDAEKKLFLSILALDSYNQGYDIKFAHEKRQIGSANLQGLSDDIDLAEWKAAGFYAVSYTIGAGVEDLDQNSTVISYRGTDNIGQETVV